MFPTPSRRGPRRSSRGNLRVPRARDERFDPAEAYLAAFDASRRCVPRALWDLQAAATRARARLDDPSLACEPSHTSFLCDPNLAPPDDPFACHLRDEPSPDPLVDMHACVWPVCEALCVASEDESPRARARDANRHAATCARCARACAFNRLRLADDAEPSPSAHRYCDALEAQRRRLEDGASYSHVDANGREDARTAAPRERERRGGGYGDAWGCPGCDAALSAAVGDGLTQASIALAASTAAQGAGLATGAVATGSAATIAAATTAAATTAAATGGSLSLVGSFLVVSARVALLNAIFWAVVNSVFVVVPPGDPLPGYVYSNGVGPLPGPGPATVPPPPPLVFGNGIRGFPAAVLRPRPGIPGIPAIPAVPGIPAIPAVPAIFDIPAVPFFVRRGGHRVQLRGRVRDVHFRPKRRRAKLLLRRGLRGLRGLLRGSGDVLRGRGSNLGEVFRGCRAVVAAVRTASRREDPRAEPERRRTKQSTKQSATTQSRRERGASRRETRANGDGGNERGFVDGREGIDGG